QRLIARKSPRSYTDQQTDLQEADTSYQSAVRELYRQMAADAPEVWTRIDVTKNDQLAGIDDLAAEMSSCVASWEWRRATGSNDADAGCGSDVRRAAGTRERGSEPSGHSRN